MFEKSVDDCKLKLVAKVQKTLIISVDFPRAVHSYDIFPGREVVAYPSIKITHEDDFVGDMDIPQRLVELVIKTINTSRSIGHCWGMDCYDGTVTVMFQGQSQCHNSVIHRFHRIVKGILTKNIINFPQNVVQVLE